MGAYTGLIGHPDGRVALIAPGFFHTVTSTELNTAKGLHGDIRQVTAESYNNARSLAAPDTGTNPELASLPRRIPLTVQGASEDFITGTMQQVLINFGQQTNTINGNVVIMRDQVRAHVTAEADRVIASV